MDPLAVTRGVLGALLGLQGEALHRLGLAPDHAHRTRAEEEAAAIVSAAEVEAEVIRSNARTTADGILRLAEEERLEAIRAAQRESRRDAG